MARFVEELGIVNDLPAGGRSLKEICSFLFDASDFKSTVRSDPVTVTVGATVACAAMKWEWPPTVTIAKARRALLR